MGDFFQIALTHSLVGVNVPFGGYDLLSDLHLLSENNFNITRAGRAGDDGGLWPLVSSSGRRPDELMPWRGVRRLSVVRRRPSSVRPHFTKIASSPSIINRFVSFSAGW